MTIKNARCFHLYPLGRLHCPLSGMDSWKGAACPSTGSQCCGIGQTWLEFILFLIGCVTWSKSFTFSEPQTHYLPNKENNTYLQRDIRSRDNLRAVTGSWAMLHVQEMGDIPSWSWWWPTFREWMGLPDSWRCRNTHVKVIDRSWNSELGQHFLEEQ